MTQTLLEFEKKLTDQDHDKYITTSKFDSIAAKGFNARLAQTNLVTKTDFDDEWKSLNQKVTTNTSKHLLVENELKKLKTLDSSYFRGKSYFEEDITQNYLVFQPIHRYFKRVNNSGYILSWKSKGLSDETIKSPPTSDDSLILVLNIYGSKARVKFTGSCLKQEEITYSWKNNKHLHCLWT